ncbi:MAG: beta-lactamase family protein, partial [Anaerolineaceae bacterium]|nr:beta-lactamase family protein [Anaerolineaceae bacterium]
GGFGHANLEHASPVESSRVFDIGSMAKQFVGTAVALLEEDGELSLDDRVGHYLPELHACARDVSLANLVYHTSGIRSYTVLAYYLMGCHESDALTSDEVYDLLARQKSLTFPAGEKWEYSDSNYYLLAKIVERISGQSLAEFTQARIFAPLEMSQTLFRDCHSRIIPHRAISYVNYPIRFQSPSTYHSARETPGELHALISNYEHVGAEGVYTTLDDLFKWDQNFLDNQLGKGGQALIERILTAGKLNDGRPTRYGLGIIIGDSRGKAFFGHDGAFYGYTSSMMHFIDENTTIICLTNHNDVGAWEYRSQIMDLIFPESVSRPPAPKIQGKRLPSNETQKITGAYQNPKTSSIWEIKNVDGVVVVEVNRAENFEITHLGSLRFIAPSNHEMLQLNFILEETGIVSEVRSMQNGKVFFLHPFLDRALTQDELETYAGAYTCDELGTTFLVDFEAGNLRFRNKNRHFCSMDLLYMPTIMDSFISYDPRPVSSQVTFLREEGRVTAFVYRDYDGDRREELIFRKQ